MELERTFVGLDVHARSVVACALDDVTGELSKARLVPDDETILAWLRALPGPLAVVYEAGPTGYGLARFLTGRGCGAWLRRRRSCTGPRGTGSRPTRGMRCC